MNGPDPLLCWLWLSHVLGPANGSARDVLKRYGNAQNAWAARETEEFQQMVGPASAGRALRLDPEDDHELVMWCDAMDVRILTCYDLEYPRKFLEIPSLPPVLYCTGDVGWLNAPATVGLVGTRDPSPYGKQAAADIGRGLARAGAVIVSGLAVGLDSVGHQVAVKEHGPTIGILGIPIDETYPATNRRLRREMEANGCVISEYPPRSRPLGKNGFLMRNRLIAALSSVLVVVEAREKHSGTLYTVKYAQDYHRPVYAVPGSIYTVESSGTNALLRDGKAKAVCRAEALFEALNLHPPVQNSAKPAASSISRPTPAPLSEVERKILACVGPAAKGMEELGMESGLPLPLLSSTLMKLELAGRVTCLPGKRYILR